MKMKRLHASARGGRPSWLVLGLAWTLATALVLCGSTRSTAQDGEAVYPEAVYPEYEIKAAFLINFTSYVTWPEEAFANDGSPFVIGIAGENPSDLLIEKSFPALTHQGRKLEIRRVETAKEAASCCHLIFVSRDKSNLLPHLLHDLHDNPVLLVGEAERFVREGGGINLLVSQERTVEFEINLDATERADLRLNSRLLLLAKRVWKHKRWMRTAP